MKPRITKAAISAYAAALGSLGGRAQPLEAKRRGGKASAAKLTPEERRERGRRAGLASQAKRRNHAS